MVQNSSISHNVALIPQPTPTSCWAASTAMLLGTSVGAVQSRTPADLMWPDGSLKNYSDEKSWLDGTRRYAAAHGLQYGPPRSWSVGALHERLSHGPVIFDLLWNHQQYAAGAGSPGHVVLLVGMSGEGADTEVTINDPWPPNRGDVVTRNYYALMQDVPTLTYRTFWR